MSLKKTAILDIDSIAFSIGAGNKVLDETGQPIKVLSDKGNMVFQYTEKTQEELKQSADWRMNDILTKCGATHYIGFIKNVHTTQSRLAINPEYKANRKDDAPPWWLFVKLYLHSVWGIQHADNAEVDDLVNITRLQLPDSFIVAVDGDLLGLKSINPHYNWKINEWVTVSKEQANKKFWSDMICGQTGDNIKGLPGKGKKYVDELFKKIIYQTDLEYAELVYSAYLVHYGNVDQAIKEYYKNYTSLHILDQKEGFIIPEPIEFKRKEINLI